jgi:hypothetical protein
MQSDTVQIGSLVISKSVFDAFIVLASVIVGGLVTYFTTRALENKRWAQQKADRLQDHRREALSLALDWIPPIEIALSRATSLASGYLQGHITEDHLYNHWPNLLSQLAKKDLPMRLNVLLPPSIQRRVNEIIRQLEQLQTFALRSKPATKTAKVEWKNQFGAFTQLAHALTDNFDALNHELLTEHANSYQ